MGPLTAEILMPGRLVNSGRSDWRWGVLLFELREPGLARMHIAQKIEIMIKKVYRRFSLGLVKRITDE